MLIEQGGRKGRVEYHRLMIFANEVLKMVDDHRPAPLALESRQDIHSCYVIPVETPGSDNLVIFYENAHVT